MGRLHVRVQPGARRTALAGWFGDHPKIAIAAPPVDGAANEALVAWAAGFFGTRARDVRIVGGAASRSKRLEVDGIADAELLARIEAAIPRPPG
jgi:uncharacterized protein (TIGR00251 family)